MTPEEIELLSELTIIIPTHNRPLELERAIEYWRDTPVTVHILDGSEKPWFPVGILPSVPKISYHHIPAKQGDFYMANYSHRMRIAVNLPTGKFSALCADDDFFTITAMVEFCRRLSTDSNVDVLVGKCSEYKMADQGTCLWNLRYTEWMSVPDSHSDDVQKRILDSSSLFYTYYAIMRSDVLKRSLSLTYEEVYDHDYFYEHLQKVFCRALGKAAVLPSIYWVKKSFEYNSSIPNQSSRVREADWFRDKKNELSVKAFRYQLARGIATIASESQVTFDEHEIVESYVKRLARITDTTIFRKARSHFLAFVVKVFQVVPPQIRLFINKKLPKKIGVMTGFLDERPHRELIKNNWWNLDSFIREASKTDLRIEESDFEKITRVLLMPREELRLRANI